MERILIIGCSGSGKSRLARALGQKQGLPVIHLDQLWWKENWQNVTKEEFDSRLAMALNMDRWIIDGNYSRTMEARLSRCDTVIYLDFSRWACLLGMCQRILRYPENSAGSIMTTEYVSLRPSMTVGEAILRIRRLSGVQPVLTAKNQRRGGLFRLPHRWTQDFHGPGGEYADSVQSGQRYLHGL